MEAVPEFNLDAIKFKSEFKRYIDRRAKYFRHPPTNRAYRQGAEDAWMFLVELGMAKRRKGHA